VLGDRAAAEDCAQDTFERAYKRLASWRPDAPVEEWLHRIAINVAISDRRRYRFRQVGELVGGSAARLQRPTRPLSPNDRT
jgi:RNA polymerase sigma-70 factor (ECF subfamily)